VPKRGSADGKSDKSNGLWSNEQPKTEEQKRRKRHFRKSGESGVKAGGQRWKVTNAIPTAGRTTTTSGKRLETPPKCIAFDPIRAAEGVNENRR
jgi:hypothetical protein